MNIEQKIQIKQLTLTWYSSMWLAPIRIWPNIWLGSVNDTCIIVFAFAQVDIGNSIMMIFNTLFIW